MMIKQSAFLVLSLLILTACDNPTKKDFIKNCIDGGGNEKACSCSYDILKKEIGEDTLEKLAKKSDFDSPEQAEKVMQASVKAVLQCAATN